MRAEPRAETDCAWAGTQSTTAIRASKNSKRNAAFISTCLHAQQAVALQTIQATIQDVWLHYVNSTPTGDTNDLQEYVLRRAALQRRAGIHLVNQSLGLADVARARSAKDDGLDLRLRCYVFNRLARLDGA